MPQTLNLDTLTLEPCTQVGVDLNAAAQNPWLAAQLPFVGGLGPVKAAALTRAMQRKRAVDSRKAVWQMGVMGDRVFR